MTPLDLPNAQAHNEGMKTLRQTYSIHAPLDQVWKALVDPKVIEAWGGGPAIMDEKVGTKFSLWNGDIHGTNLEVATERKLVQDWYGGKWDNPSKVTFHLSNDGSGTMVSLIHENVPDDAVKSIDSGWHDYYLGPLKKFVESTNSQT